MSSAEQSAKGGPLIAFGSVPKVSVAMHTYNHERFIAQAIESVLMQRTGFTYELVIGEDCSPDRTREIVLNYRERYPDKIHLLLSEKNLGPGGNFVQTVRACRGEYIAILDGDDYWTSSEKLQRQIDFLDDHPECSICIHGVKSLYEDGHFDYAYPPEKKVIYTLEDLLLGNFINSCSAVFRRNLFGDFPSWYLDRRVIGDWELHVLNAHHGDIGYIDEFMGVYRIHRGGKFTGIDLIQKTTYRIEAAKFLNAQLNYRFDKILKRNISNHYLGLVNPCLINGDRGRARQCLLKALVFAPPYRILRWRKLVKLFFKAYFPLLVPFVVDWRDKLVDRHT